MTKIILSLIIGFLLYYLLAFIAEKLYDVGYLIYRMVKE